MQQIRRATSHLCNLELGWCACSTAGAYETDTTIARFPNDGETSTCGRSAQISKIIGMYFSPLASADGLMLFQNFSPSPGTICASLSKRPHAQSIHLSQLWCFLSWTTFAFGKKEVKLLSCILSGLKRWSPVA